MERKSGNQRMVKCRYYCILKFVRRHLPKAYGSLDVDITGNDHHEFRYYWQ